MSSQSITASGMPRNPMVGSRLVIFRPLVSSRIARKPPMPSNAPCSSYTLAKIRCRRDTPPPVIQCLRPLMTKRLPLRSARVVMPPASEPASGSVMQMAGLSPDSTMSAASFFWSSEP